LEHLIIRANGYGDRQLGNKFEIYFDRSG